MAYPSRAMGGMGILLAIGAAHFDLPWWVAAIGGMLCIAFLVMFIRDLI